MYHGADRHTMSAKFKDSDIILTTYETMRADSIAHGPLHSENWYRLVLDEGSSHTLLILTCILLKKRQQITYVTRPQIHSEQPPRLHHDLAGV